MRGFLVSSIGVATAAALALPLALTSPSLAAGPGAPPATAGAPAAGPGAVPAAPPAAGPAAAAEPAVPGSTQSLPLTPLTPGSRRAFPGMSARLPDTAAVGLAARETGTFSMVGVVWDDARTELHGRVQVRTRSAHTGTWTAWQDVEIHNREHAADPGTAEGASRRVKGSTAPLWVGESDGIEVRVQAEPGEAPGAPVAPEAGEASDATGHRAAEPEVLTLPTGMRIELVDPGRTPAPAEEAALLPAAGGNRAGRHGASPAVLAALADPTAHTGSDGPGPDEKAEAAAAAETSGDAQATILPAVLPAMSQATIETSAANLGLAPLGADAIEARDKAGSAADVLIASDGKVGVAARPYIGPRPRIVTRKGWGANESLREKGFVYTGSVKAAFVHHSASGNNYKCSEAPAVLRSLYRYHVVSSGWRDFGYNFAVDKCGTVYEGRAGGVAKAVLGAHTMGFNTNSMGVAVIGTFTSSAPPAAAVKAIAQLTAWKLGLYGANPLGKATLKSGGGNLYPKGKQVKLNVISGHRDGFATECPGKKLYGKLGTARSTSARLQGR
ncbi:peptidoglycan recognition protein [Streptomyces sp. NPDC101118]|uniref:peptidoglycan recognition protein family protein n=1 Tax=Streptomyces sp. NPDC101118 TaxID=3366109 RepID=UPI0038073FC8